MSNSRVPPDASRTDASLPVPAHGGTVSGNAKKRRRTGRSNSTTVLPLSVRFPHLQTDWHPTLNGLHLHLDDLSSGSTTRIFWQCAKCDHVWNAVLCRRTSGGHGCPACGKRRVTDANRLSLLFPDLAAEWHPHKNGHLLPDNVAVHSRVKIWWKCSIDGCTHEWRTSVAYRTRNHTECPRCVRRRKLETRALSILRPDIAAQWHPTNNHPLLPSEICVSSCRSVWWRCAECLYDWPATVANRTKEKGSGCPRCAGKVLSSNTSLAGVAPSLAADWDFDKNEKTPDAVFAYSHDGAYWNCGICGLKYFSTIANRTRGTGCPECARRLYCIGSSKTEQALVDILRTAFHVPDSAKLQDVFHADNELVCRINREHGTGFCASYIKPDIFFRSGSFGFTKHVFIEYDSMVHANNRCIEQDIAKTRILLSNGNCAVIRLREIGLPLLPFGDHLPPDALYAEIPVRCLARLLLHPTRVACTAKELLDPIMQTLFSWNVYHACLE